MDKKEKIDVVRYDKVRNKKIFQANHIFGNNKHNYIEQEREKKRKSKNRIRKKKYKISTCKKRN